MRPVWAAFFPATNAIAPIRHSLPNFFDELPDAAVVIGAMAPPSAYSGSGSASPATLRELAAVVLD
ncbi:hypothetical protein [Agromyces sp. NPDC049794]|uniref:hypothetical protein n=1 Tax=unclassified Agromyces TaxID=2639701 RepID=UPI0033C21252